MSLDNIYPSIFLTEPMPPVYKYPTGTLPPWIIKVGPGNYRIDIGNAPEIPVKLYECQEIMEALNTPGEHFHMDVVSSTSPPERRAFQYYPTDRDGKIAPIIPLNDIEL